MRLETFFEKFELFADAPNAVAKMRELVLRMATSGRIAAQDPGDQPAHELLAEIFSLRDKQVKQGTAKGRVAGSPIPAGDTLDIPGSWARCMVSEVCDLQTGATPSRQEPSYFGGDIPWLVSGDVNRSQIVDCDGRISERGMQNSNCKVIPPDSVLIALNGQGKTRATVALLRIPAALNQSLVAMIPYSRERLLPEYLFWNLRGRYYAIRDITGQDQRRGLNMKLVGQLSLSIPPLAEQKRIVAKIDELMALCDRLEAQQQERQTRHDALARASLSSFAEAPTPANLDFLFHDAYAVDPVDLRKSILTLAVQGKLVPQDPNDESAKDAISRIAKLRSARKAKEYTPVAADEIPYDVPFGWAWVRLGNIALTSDSGWSPQCSSEARSGTDWGVLKVSAVSWGVFKPEENKALPPGMPSRPDCEVKPGDFLLSRANTEELVARSVVVDQTPPHLMMSDKIVRFTFPGEIVRAFINLANTSDPSRAYYARNASGTSSSMKNVGREVMCNLPIPLPPIAEQRRIVAKVDQLMALVDQLEARLAASNTAAAALLEAVVAELTAAHSG